MKCSIVAVPLIVLTCLLLVFRACDESCAAESRAPAQAPTCVRSPEPGPADRGRLPELPVFNAESPRQWQVDVRSADVSGLDLRQRERDLLNADFDSRTRWPALLPSAFQPDRLMEIGRNPGLGVRSLHAQGITGRGVGIAIIDLPLLLDHVEYRDRLRLYEEIPASTAPANMHAPAVASIAVGRTVGVAPDADLYFIATSFTGRKYFVDGDYPGRDFTHLARSIDRVVELNRGLPAERRIRVISTSIGWDRREDGYSQVRAATRRARAAGVFVLSCSIDQTYADAGFSSHGLGRAPLSDPELASSYGPGYWWENDFARNGMRPRFEGKQRLLIPMDSRCVAAPTGPRDYVFYRHGGWSWTIPYMAGLYAMACQVRPDVTPEEFWTAALATGDHTVVDVRGARHPLEVIVNPPRLLARLQGK